ncbi:MAG: TetR/AcrR family transcriptional regulator [Eubacterium sp.]|jgi:AcrR family transcriptional regulator|nr:TetR/AcrR family transcriptional regulator [Eubacterium sp.]
MDMPRQGLNTETVIKAAASLVEDNGYKNLTLHKLALKLNIKPASLYTHISGIEELYLSLANLALNQLSAMMTDAARGKRRGNALRAVSAAFCQYVRQNPEMYQIIMLIPHSHSEELVETGRAVKSILFEILSQYTDDNGKIIFYSRFYHSILHGFVSLDHAGFFDDTVPADASFMNIIDNFIEQLERI